MLRRFAKDTLIYGASNILTRATSLLLLPLYTRVLSPTDYGVIDYLKILEAFIALTIALEVTQAIGRMYPDAQDRSERIGYASTALWFTLGVYALFLTSGILFAETTSAFLLGPSVEPVVFQVAVVAITASGIFYFLLNQLRWQLDSFRYATVSFVASLSKIVATIAFVLWLRTGVIGVFYGQVCGYTIGLVMGAVWTRTSFALRFDAGRWKEMIAYSLPLVPSSVAVFLSSYVDRIALRELLNLEALGVYGVGFRVASIVTLALTGIQGALMPLVMTHYDEPGTPAKLARLFRYFCVGAISLFVGLSLFRRELIRLLASPPFSEAETLVPLLVPAALLSGMYIFAPGLNIEKRTTNIAIINIIGAGVNGALNVILIPVVGIQGAAVATVAGSALTFSAMMGFSQHYYPVPHAWGRLGRAALSGVVVVGGFRIVAAAAWFPEHGLAAWAIKALVLTGTAGMMVFVLVGGRELADLWSRASLKEVLEAVRAGP